MATLTDSLEDISNFNSKHATLHKRTRRDSDSGAENDLIVHSLKVKRVKSTGIRRQSFIVKSKEMKAYFRLLDDSLVFDFLSADGCKRISDKYLLAMVFAYFKRAGFSTKEFTRINFFVALYLANDMEEDEEDYKYEIFPWALGKGWKNKYIGFLRKRDKLWMKIGYRAVVSKKCCDEVMAIDAGHWCWQRERLEHHTGAMRAYMRDPDDDGYPRGPDLTPWLCKQCSEYTEYDSASPGSISWYLSSGSESSQDDSYMMNFSFVPPVNSRFNMEGLKQTLQAEDGIWAHDEE
ncbi:Speedy protein 1-B [Lamellibrachia satsuma]|nr:Speedy protein 1-B [Lamellibrachia satsuma]